MALAMAPAVSNGFARFAYALILPAMRSDLEWSYAMAGWINTANAIGYLLGALLTFWLSGRMPAARLFTRGMLMTALALLASGMTGDIALLSLFRILAGIGGAAMFISGDQTNSCTQYAYKQQGCTASSDAGPGELST